MQTLHYARNAARLIGASTIVLAMSGIAFGAGSDFSGSNDTTGANSENRNEYDLTRDVSHDIVNDGTLENIISASVDTGNNEISENTEAGDLRGGDVDIRGRFEGEVNDMSHMGAGAGVMASGLGSIGGDFENRRTGASSTNENTLDLSQDIRHTIRNTADAVNSFALDANTGNNTATRNTIVGDVITGGTSADLSFDTTLNQGASSAWMMGLGGSTGTADFDMSNDTTGFNSLNTNTVSASSTETVDVSNDASITNTFSVSANSGNNDVSENTTAGDLRTGDVSLDFTATSSAN